MPAWLVLSAALQCGYLPAYYEAIGPSEEEYADVYQQTITLQAVALDHVRVWTDLQTFETRYEGNEIGFCPFRSTYRIGAELFAKNIALGVWHECIHPTLSARKLAHEYYLTDKTEVYIKVLFSTN